MSSIEIVTSTIKFSRIVGCPYGPTGTLCVLFLGTIIHQYEPKGAFSTLSYTEEFSCISVESH